MNGPHHPSAIGKFLGADADGGPLQLLGLAPLNCTPSRIEAALQMRLERVDAHPESATPEADDVRLALHSAAAQLLDPSVRRLLLGKAAAPVARAANMESTMAEISPEPDVSMEGARVPAPQPVVAATAPITSDVAPNPGPRRDAQTRQPALIRDEPDPNRNVRRFVVGVGVFAALFVIAGTVGLIFLTSGRTSLPPSTPTATSSPNTQSDETTVGAKATATASPTAPAPDATASAPAPTGQERSGSEAAAPAKAGKSEFTDPVLVVRQLRAATALVKTDPSAALAAFKSTVPGIADWWCRFDTAQRRAADDSVVEFLYATASLPEVSVKAVNELGSRAELGESGAIESDKVWPAAWAAGVLTRMSNERELPRGLAALVNSALNDGLGAGRVGGVLSFETGANASLRLMPGRLIAPYRSASESSAGDANAASGASAIREWVDAVLAVNHDAMESERVMTEGLEQILISGPEPDADLGAYEAIEFIVTRIKWHEGGPARDRLLDWFLNPEVSPTDLRALTGVLANKSGAENVDATMVLSLGASQDDRAKLRSKYAAAWGIVQSEARDKAARNWRVQSDYALASPIPNEQFAQVIALVGAARYNLAARRLWLGDAAGAAKIVDETPGLLSALPALATQPGSSGSPAIAPPPGSPQPQPVGPGRAPRGPTFISPGKPADPYSPSGVDGHWAEAYLKAERNIPVRLERLAALDNLPTPIGGIDAAVLAEAACFASPVQVRAAAQKALNRFGDDPAMVEAMLNMLPSAPRIVWVAQGFERVARTRLPKVGDPDWELTTRRALVERLLSMLAAEGDQAGIELGAVQVSEAYIRMSGVESGPPDETAADRTLRGVSGLLRLMRAEAERLPTPAGAPYSLDQIERRRESRAKIASGPTQQFAAEQAAVAETLAYIVCAERPMQAAKVAVVIANLTDARRRADHVFTQMLANEHAILRLWLLRYGEGSTA